MVLILLACAAMAVFPVPGDKAQVVCEWDFARGTQGWVSNRTARIKEAKDGIVVETDGSDPQLMSPVLHIQPAKGDLLEVRMAAPRMSAMMSRTEPMTMTIRNPPVYVIAGPNGAVKTTFAAEFLPDFVNCRQFLNADLIAAGLSPFAPETQNLWAGRLLLERIKQLAEEREDFGFETTLSGRTYVRLLTDLKQVGYRVVLFFLWLPSADLAVERVASRVQKGGRPATVHPGAAESVPAQSHHARCMGALRCVQVAAGVDRLGEGRHSDCRGRRPLCRHPAKCRGVRS